MRLFYSVFFFSWMSGSFAQDYSFMRPIMQGYQEYIGAVVLTAGAPLYENPDTKSPVIKTLAFLSPAHILESGSDENAKMYWYKIRSGSTEGFIRVENIAQHSFRNDKTKKLYLLQALDHANDSLHIFTYHTGEKRFTDTLKGPNLVAESFYRVKMQETALKNAEVVLRITHIMPYCGGGENDFYFVDANHEMSFLFSAFAGGDIGDIAVTSPWLPVKKNGKIELRLHGDFSVDSYDKNITRVYQVHPSCNIPAEEMIVLRSQEILTEFDENGEEVRNEDGTEKTTLVKDVTVFYRWDGKRLLK